ncbi:MAG: glycosyltransferase family 4 protein [Actinomycetota bacterium]
MGAYLVVLLVALGASYLATPLVLRLSRRVGAVDIPDDRKVHAVPTPTLGGIAIFLGFLAAFAVSAGLGTFRETTLAPLLAWPPSTAVVIAIGAAFVFVLGVVDDLTGLPAPVKLAGQIVAAGFVFLLGGVKLQWLRWPLGTLSLGPAEQAIVTIVWIVVIVNAVNLIDGLDGLAGGITAIAAATFFVYSYQLSRGMASPEFEQTAPLVSIAIVGAMLGFLPFNFNPARIFMGDSGSMTAGFLLATATVAGVGRASPVNPLSESVIFYLPVVIPVIVLAIPILDTALAVVRRARMGRHIFQADKQHLHHRLLEIGHGHRQAVLILYAWTAVIAGAGLALSFLPDPRYTLLFVAAGVAIFLYTILPRLAGSRAARAATAVTPVPSRRGRAAGEPRQGSRRSP